MYNTFAILDNMIYHCWAWVNSESLRMTGTCPCVIIVVTLVTSLLPQVSDYQIVLQGGNGCKGKKLYVGEMVEGTHAWKNLNKFGFSLT